MFGRALRLHRERERVRPETFARRRTLIEHAAERLTFGPPLGEREAWQLQKRYRRHRDKLFVCLHRADVEPTNDSSERDLRNSVIHEEVSGAYRSKQGAAASATFGTILTTAHKRGRDLLVALAPCPARHRSRPPARLPEQLPKDQARRQR